MQIVIRNIIWYRDEFFPDGIEKAQSSVLGCYPYVSAAVFAKGTYGRTMKMCMYIVGSIAFNLSGRRADIICPLKVAAYPYAALFVPEAGVDIVDWLSR